MKEKTILGLCLGLGSYLIGKITMVTIVFFAFMLIDFLTGVLGSKAADEVYEPEKAWKGVIKKAGYLLFWVMGVLVELVIIEEGSALGIQMNLPIVSLAVTAWLLGTEGLSILNNLHKMGVKGIPKWFVNYFDKMKSVSDNITTDVPAEHQE